jgi:hypothetical protein
MSFVLLADLLGYKAKVIARGNHSWSELIIPMNDVNKQKKNILVTIDNTYDQIHWGELENISLNEWANDLGDSPLKVWYNKKAHLTEYKDRFLRLILPSLVMNKIDDRVATYLIN